MICWFINILIGIKITPSWLSSMYEGWVWVVVVILTVVNSLTPLPCFPSWKCHLSPSRDRLPENKSFGAGLRDGPSARGAWSRICSVLCFQHMIDPISYGCGLFIIKKQWVFNKGPSLLDVWGSKFTVVFGVLKLLPLVFKCAVQAIVILQGGDTQ